MKCNMLYYLYLKIFHRKEKKFQILLWTGIVLMVYFGFQFWEKASAALSQILPRTAWGKNEQILIQITKKTLKDDNDKPLFIPGSPLYQYTPDLVLLGEVKRVEQEDKSDPECATLYVDVFPQHQNKVMRKNSQFEIFKESPSFYFILQTMMEKRTIPIFDLDLQSARSLENRPLSKEDDLFQCFARYGIPLSETSTLKVIKKGKEWILNQNIPGEQSYPIVLHEKQGDKKYYVYGKIQQRTQIIAKNSQQKYMKVLELFAEKLKKNGSPQAEKIVQDKKIQGYIFTALNNEVLSKLDVKKIANSVSSNPDTKKIFQNVAWFDVFRSVGGSFLSGAGKTLEEKALQGTEEKKGLGKILTIGWNVTLSYIFKKDTVWETMKGGGADALGEGFDELGKIIKKNPELSAKVGQKVLEEIEIADKFGYGLQSLFQDKEFTEYIKNKYGENTLAIFQKSCYDMVGLPEVKQTLESIKYQVEESAGFVTANIVLNDKKDGINPALLIFVREKLLQAKEPQIVFFDTPKNKETAVANNDNVTSGHKYIQKKSVTEFEEN
ncbi:MAG: hypothetical protein HUU50_23030 [Candidatus Brocadiae bacterium]|nr:hypothetical protein [Candidatus Brocadiia bacterium]